MEGDSPRMRFVYVSIMSVIRALRPSKRIPV